MFIVRFDNIHELLSNIPGVGSTSIPLNPIVCVCVRTNRVFTLSVFERCAHETHGKYLMAFYFRSDLVAFFGGWLAKGGRMVVRNGTSFMADVDNKLSVLIENGIQANPNNFK